MTIKSSLCILLIKEVRWQCQEHQRMFRCNNNHHLHWILRFFNDQVRMYLSLTYSWGDSTNRMIAITWMINNWRFFLSLASRQLSNNPSTPSTLRRKNKGHVRNRSSKGGGSGGFQPTHRRNQSVLSKISKLSIITLGTKFLEVYIWFILPSFY